jgi:hypothetical protein
LFAPQQAERAFKRKITRFYSNSVLTIPLNINRLP